MKFSHLFLFVLSGSLVTAQSLASKTGVTIRFTDSATGYALQPDELRVQRLNAGASEEVSVHAAPAKGSTTLALEPGQYYLTASAANHEPMSGAVEVTTNFPFTLDFKLDPSALPDELRPESVAAARRDGYTLIQGFVAADESGEALADVRVNASPGGESAVTDARGFFRFYIPVDAASLTFHRPGFRMERRENLELWSGGDWTYRIRLASGGGVKVVDERIERRMDVRTGSAGATNEVSVPSPTPEQIAALFPTKNSGIHPMSTAASNATIRVPRNIRVLKSDGVTVDYVTMDTYCKHVLPAEWIASWGSITGGSNSLNAGAVAARCYAIAKLNGSAPGNTNYDICATTSCQVYGSTTSANTDTACNFTLNWVVISGGAIPSTEYSAEDNSLGFGCGDGYTQPTGGCTFDPVCSGETRAGHGRGMCQWGTAKWATGRKMTGNVTGVTTPYGYPLQDWKWIVQHYYPSYTLVKGAFLVIGDDVKATTTVNVNMCADGGITNGINCPLIAALPGGTTGTIVDGPQQITADGRGYTFYKVQWNDASSTLGWAKENYIERVFVVPTAPSGLTATAVATNQINLSWTDTTNVESGFKIERAISANGPWMQINIVAANVTSYSDKNLYPGSTWFYRVRAFNAGGNSAYSGTASATTTNSAATLPPIGTKNVNEGSVLTFTNTASASDFVKLITDFENFTTETTNGLPLLRSPRFSGSTSANLAATPDLTIVTDAYVTNGHGTGKVLRVNCNFTNATNPWLRLTTGGAASWPNPVINLTNKLRFDIWSDKTLKVAVGCRETTTTAGTAIGSDGGTTGGIEWAGVTNVVSGVPQPGRNIAQSNWTTLTFSFATEPIANFSGGNGVLSTASSLGTLEHLAIVPTAGTGNYNFYLDNFAVLAPRTFTYSLSAGSPAGASINATNGVFTWTPTEAQGPMTNTISVIVADNSSPSMSATQTFTVIVNEVNTAPVLAAISNRIVHAGMLVTFTNSASDTDAPPNVLNFTLDPSAPAAASVDPNSGMFSWLTTDGDAGTTNEITMRVTDNGTPPFDAAQSFTIAVLARPMVQSMEIFGGDFVLTWSAIPGTTYRVQFKGSLDDANWTDLVPDVTATGPTANFNDPLGEAQRFYRILVVNQ
jgi:hypothetical protein